MKDAFAYAIEGLKYAFWEQPNVRREMVIAGGVAGLALLLGFSTEEWAILVLTMGLVFMTELMNTAVEAAVDVATSRVHPKAKIAKDVAAGMVLLSALVSVIVGILLFGPKIISLVGKVTF